MMDSSVLSIIWSSFSLSLMNRARASCELQLTNSIQMIGIQMIGIKTIGIKTIGIHLHPPSWLVSTCHQTPVPWTVQTCFLSDEIASLGLSVTLASMRLFSMDSGFSSWQLESMHSWNYYTSCSLAPRCQNQHRLRLLWPEFVQTFSTP